jgi:hypothetical protein
MTFATTRPPLCSKQGASVGEVMDRDDWRNVEMLNRYRHLLEAKDVAAAKALENA